jgi:hypothetical protein
MLIWLIGLLAFPVFASQTVWKWVDNNGVTHFSDTPVAGATKVEVSTSNRDARPAPAYSPPSSIEPVNTGPSYRHLEIWKPVADQSIVNTGGQVTVNVRVDPALRSDHQIVLTIDGRRMEGFARNTQQFDLKDISRGTHVAVAQILDGRGTKLQETAPVTFHVRQESAAQPPVGPNLRPRPKPRP